MRINEAIVRWLESVGVDAAFGGASENVASCIIALRHSRKIKSDVTRNEQAASFAVRGYAVFAPQAWCLLETGGSDAFNLPSGLALAMSRLLAIAGYTSLAERSPPSSRC
jgi:acetolactate synthase I/II/III large subunit